ncbi:phosphatidylinositol 3-kinase regulatory subunit alpha-like [Odontesthes bonariensis]|uniref:phosphatidylinositol 3-kinase regulatory subunit alpha-like n=1 Tax=Odontesthes bonariensis TaxID=219752 RepID=UPI003F5819BF
MASESLQYRALFEYQRERGDGVGLQPGDLQPGDLLTVQRASPPEHREGWLHGVNERTKEKGDFPRTYVEYVGGAKPRPRPAPQTPGGPPAAVPGAAAASGVEVLCAAAPVVVWRLIEAIEKQGLNSDLYRAPAASGGPPELRQALDSDPVSVDLDQYDVVSLTDALRGFLQDLPGPIIPDTVYSELVYTAQESQTVDECGERLQRILESPSVPQANHRLLARLSRHLDRVGQHGRAGPRLLGQAFAHLVFKPSALSAEVNLEHHIRILEALISSGGLMDMQPAPVLAFSLWKTLRDDRVHQICIHASENQSNALHV